MITEHDLAEAIAECEGQRNPNANTCLKLAALYTIKDKMYPNDVQRSEKPTYSYAADPGADQSTEFMQAVIGMNADEFLEIMDELMSTLKTLVPRLYDGVMRKLTK